MNIKLAKQTAALVLAISIMTSAGCIFKKEKPVPPVESTAPQTADTPATKDLPSTAEEPAKKQTDIEKPKEEAPKPASVIVSEAETTLTVGQKKTVNADVMPTKEPVVWSSSDSAVAEVDVSGTITAKKAGKCVITAAAQTDKNVSAHIAVTVHDPAPQSSAPSQPSQTSSQAPSSPSSQTAAQTSEGTPTQTTITESYPSEAEQNTSSNAPVPVTALSLTLDSTVLMKGQTVTPTIILTPTNADNTAVTLTTSDESVIFINYDGSITAAGTGAATLTAASADNESVTASVILTVAEPYAPEEPSEDYPREECYIDGILIVNKTYSLPRSYNPGGLTPETAAAFEELRRGAAADGINIYLSSGFRSYDYQSQLYNGYVAYYGQASADTFSARPGHSEHQTGMAIDCNIINDSFIGTPEAIWLENHCHEYGFILRYPQGKQSVTGYKYEPWHIRYIGDKAEEIYYSGLTLEEYYGITSVYGG